MSWTQDQHGFEYKGHSAHFYLRNVDLSKTSLSEWLEFFKKKKFTTQELADFRELYAKRFRK